MAEYALHLQNATDTAARVRLAAALGLHPADALNARSGIRGAGGTVTVNAGTMQVQVAPLVAWVDGGTSDAQGGYPFVLDAAKTLTLADGDPSLARTDVIVVRVRDDAYDSSGSTDAQVTVVQGTPGAGVPALPASATPLREVTVPAGKSAGNGGLTAGNLGTDRRQWLPMGVLPVSSLAERNALTPVRGMFVYRGDSGDLQGYDGADWQTWTPVDDTGWQAVTLAAGWSNESGEELQARRIGSTVYLRGRCKPNATATVNAGTPVAIATLPAGSRPATSVFAPVSSSAGTLEAFVLSDGSVKIRYQAGGSVNVGTTGYVAVAGLSGLTID